MDEIDTASGMVHGTSLTGTLMSGASQTTTAKVGKALQLNTNQYVNFGLHDNCLSNINKCVNGLTVALWIDFQGTMGSWASVFNTNSDMIVYFRKVSASSYTINLYCLVNASPGTLTSVTASSGISGWQHLACSCSKTNVGHVYLNGQEIAGNPSSYSGTWGDGSRNIWLGKVSSSYIEPFLADELYIWFKELAQSDINKYYNLGNSASNIYSSLVKYVSMEDIQSTALTGNGLTGTLMGGASQTVTSKFGKALELNTDQYLNLGYHGNNCLGNIALCDDGLTIGLWINFQGTLGKWASVFNTNSEMVVYLIEQSSNSYGINLYCYASSSGGTLTSITTTLSTSDWQHMCVSCSKTNEGHVFLNGQEIIDSSPSSYSGSYGDGSKNVWLGKIHNSYKEPFLADELYIWNSVLSSSDVAVFFSIL